MTASDNSNLPWVTGEFDIAALHRGAPRILNRAQFLDHVDRELQRAKRSIEPRFVVVFMDLDNYAAIVNEKGKKAADMLIRACVEPVGALLSPRDAIAIMRSGTIAILLETARLRGMAQDFAAEMAGEMKKAAGDCGLETATTSIGIVKLTGGYVAAEDILRDADIALRVAQSKGPDHTEVFHRAMEEEELHTSIAI